VARLGKPGKILCIVGVTGAEVLEPGKLGRVTIGRGVLGRAGIENDDVVDVAEDTLGVGSLQQVCPACTRLADPVNSNASNCRRVCFFMTTPLSISKRNLYGKQRHCAVKSYQYQLQLVRV
jgi:hypothetical protein